MTAIALSQVHDNPEIMERALLDFSPMMEGLCKLARPVSFTQFRRRLCTEDAIMCRDCKADLEWQLRKLYISYLVLYFRGPSRAPHGSNDPFAAVRELVAA